MKRLFEKILLAMAANLVRRYKPIIIGITGNTGKTSTKEAIATVLHGRRWRVRTAAGNLNNELGFALTILGGKKWDRQYYEHGISKDGWFVIFVFGLLATVLGQSNFPDILILEYGADQPGDIRRLVQKFKPHISVITTTGDVPVHIEFFKNADALADEKANLVNVLSASDYAILNHDDHRVLGMKSKTKAHVLTYGFEEGAMIRASDIEYTSDEEGRPIGVTFKLNEDSHFTPVRIEGSLGKSQAWSAAAAAAVGLVLGMNLVQINEALRDYHGPKGRLKILRGIKNSNIIDDTYNASPASTRLALETLRDVPALRKIAVLGDMLELGEHSEKAHHDIGVLASEIADVLVCVGSRAKSIASAFAKATADTAITDSKEVFTFDNSDDAKLKVKDLIQEHDLILVKGSQGMRMEKIVVEIIAEPSQAKNLLVRQSQKWLAVR